MKRILITGAAGFIGSYITKKLLDNNFLVIGIDNLNDYYDTTLKKDRIKDIKNDPNFIFIKENICNKDKIKDIFNKYKPDIVLHLAAYAGVRYSTINPDIYINTNIIGFYNILTLSSEYRVKHMIFASSSSIYGNQENVPYKENNVNMETESIYASTKLCDEVISNSYSKLYDMPITALRLFTVYGPYGRPDMAYFNFTNKLVNNESITIYNKGTLKRDFTYITDAINGIYNIIINDPKEKYNVYNIGTTRTYTVNDLVNIIKKELIDNDILSSTYDFDSKIIYSDIAKGDVLNTRADITKMEQDFNYNPTTTLEEGIKEFIKWYKEYYYK